MTKWDKLVEEVEKIQIDISSPSKYVPRFLELWKQTRAEGNRMQRMNKNLAYEITVHKKKIIELENKTREWDEMVCNICKDLCPKKLEAIRPFIMECKDIMVKEAILGVLGDE